MADPNVLCLFLYPFRSGSVDLEPLPSSTDSFVPANRRGSSESGSQGEKGTVLQKDFSTVLDFELPQSCIVDTSGN